jgi:hypothetical protein
MTLTQYIDIGGLKMFGVLVNGPEEERISDVLGSSYICGGARMNGYIPV